MFSEGFKLINFGAIFYSSFIWEFLRVLGYVDYNELPIFELSIS